MVGVRAEGNLRKIGIFSELSKRDLKAIERLMTEVEVRADTALTRQGEPGREFMILRSGTAHVEIDGEIVAHLSDGDFVGELAVISGTPRTATVRTTTDTVLDVMNRREFMALLDENAGLSKKILVGAIKRLQTNERTRTN